MSSSVECEKQLQFRLYKTYKMIDSYMLKNNWTDDKLM